MKKLFLASNAYLTLDKILPLLLDEPKNLKLAFIPTASELYENKSWLYKDRDKLVEMGFQVTDVQLTENTKEHLKKGLEDIDVVFVSGGNTFYLLEKVKASGFDEIIKEMIDRGVVYIGSSAGSALVSPTIGYIDGMDDPSVAKLLTSYDSLGIVDYLVVPHYGDDEYKDVFPKMLETWQNKGLELKLLTNTQALVVDGEKSEVVEVI